MENYDIFRLLCKAHSTHFSNTELRRRVRLQIRMEKGYAALIFECQNQYSVPENKIV